MGREDDLVFTSGGLRRNRRGRERKLMRKRVSYQERREIVGGVGNR